MKTVLSTGGTDGIERGLARSHLERGDRAVVVGTDEAKAKAEPGTPGHLVAVSEGVAVPLGPRTSSPADARRFYDYPREVLAR